MIRISPFKKPMVTFCAGGWLIRHCGHPTANWPYYLEHPDRTEVIVSWNGRGFKTVAVAKSAVSGILEGSIEVTTEHCADNIARTRGFTALGDHIDEERVA